MTSVSRFSELCPAGTLRELLDALRSEDDAGYMYRGQTRHYSRLTSSQMRRALTDGQGERGFLRIHPTRFNDQLSGREGLRFSLMCHLVASFDRAVGNVIAQQYGFGSEVIDFTTDLDVAAFFATRRYPSYEHFAGSEENALGVIYRAPRTSAVTSFDQLSLHLAEIGHTVSPARSVWFRRYAKRWDLSETHCKDLQCNIAAGSYEALHLYTRPMLVDYASLEPTIVQALADNWGLQLDMSRTRQGRQRGGFLRPSFCWRCFVPRERTVTSERGRLYYGPCTAIADSLVAVEDGLAYPGMQAFFFRHSSEQVTTVSREQLWPALHEDSLYEKLADMCHLERLTNEYLEREDIWVEHPAMGIIDRGYYLGDEEAKFRAMADLHKGNVVGAISRLDTLLAGKPYDAEAFAMRGLAWLRSREISKAQEDLAAAISLDHRCWHAHYYSGVCAIEADEYDTAARHLTDAIALLPHRAEAYHARATAFAFLKRYDRALEDLDSAMHQIRRLSDHIHLRDRAAIDRVFAYTMLADDAEADLAMENVCVAHRSSVRERVQEMRRDRQASR